MDEEAVSDPEVPDTPRRVLHLEAACMCPQCKTTKSTILAEIDGFNQGRIRDHLEGRSWHKHRSDCN